MNHFKYYSFDEKGAGLLIGEYQLSINDTKNLTKNDLKSLLPLIIDAIKKASPNALFEDIQSEVIIDQSTRTSFNYNYTLPEGEDNYFESRLQVFQSKTCRIDAIFVSPNNNKNYVNDLKNSFLQELHSSGKEQFWICLLYTSPSPRDS